MATVTKGIRLVLLLGAFTAAWILRLVVSVATAADGGRGDFVFRQRVVAATVAGASAAPTVAGGLRSFWLASAGGGHCCG